MKLLFDQNISYKIVAKLNQYFPGSKHVKEANLHEASDKEIWEYAKTNSFTNISHDADFSNLSSFLIIPRLLKTLFPVKSLKVWDAWN